MIYDRVKKMMHSIVDTDRFYIKSMTNFYHHNFFLSNIIANLKISKKILKKILIYYNDRNKLLKKTI